MRILGLETSCDYSSVALVEDGKLIGERVFPSRMSLCQTLAGHLTDLLNGPVYEANLDGIAVSLGPGSFTGLRMGVAMAKAMAHSLKLPLVGISTQEALCWPLARVSDIQSVWGVQHARSGEIYAGGWRCDAEVLIATSPIATLTLQDLVSEVNRIEHSVILVGDGIGRNQEILLENLSTQVTLAPQYFSIPRASVVATLASERIQDADPEAWHNLRPIYLMASQAERALGIDLGMSH